MFWEIPNQDIHIIAPAMKRKIRILPDIILKELIFDFKSKIYYANSCETAVCYLELSVLLSNVIPREDNMLLT